MNKKTLRFVGKKYTGSDEGKSLIVNGPQEVMVSEAKAKQLLKDYPKDWKDEGTTVVPVPEPTEQELPTDFIPPVEADEEEKPDEDKPKRKTIKVKGKKKKGK